MLLHKRTAGLQRFQVCFVELAFCTVPNLKIANSVRISPEYFIFKNLSFSCQSSVYKGEKNICVLSPFCQES